MFGILLYGWVVSKLEKGRWGAGRSGEGPGEKGGEVRFFAMLGVDVGRWVVFVM